MFLDTVPWLPEALACSLSGKACSTKYHNQCHNLPDMFFFSHLLSVISNSCYLQLLFSVIAKKFCCQLKIKLRRLKEGAQHFILSVASVVYYQAIARVFVPQCSTMDGSAFLSLFDKVTVSSISSCVSSKLLSTTQKTF